MRILSRPHFLRAMIRRSRLFISAGSALAPGGRRARAPVYARSSTPGRLRIPKGLRRRGSLSRRGKGAMARGSTGVLG